MRNYETVVTQEIDKRSIRQQTNNHAKNIFVGYLLMFMPIAVIFDASAYIISGVILFPILEGAAILFAAFKFGESLINFTYQDRETIAYIDEDQEDDYIIEETPQSVMGKTFLERPGGSFYVIDVGLTNSQLDQIANALLDTNTLTINYLESLGLARQDAEKLRIELSAKELVEFDKKNRVHLTDSGKRIFYHISTK